jgi:ubiquinone/menaquinone biosynthesis C-methylase UbiE
MKLHLGCGKRDFGKEWIHIDGGNFPHLHSHDITKLPFEDNSVDLIYNCHVLPYFDRDESKAVLKEWYRVLKPGSLLRTSVCDFGVMSELYTKGNFKLFNFLGPIFGKWAMGDKTIYHKTVYDFDSLCMKIEMAGFHSIRRYDWRKTEHSHIDDHSAAYLPKMDFDNGTLISLNVEAYK